MSSIYLKPSEIRRLFKIMNNIHHFVQYYTNPTYLTIACLIIGIIMEVDDDALT